MNRPPPNASLVVVAYDTPDDRRRRRLARLLDDFGKRVQGSVFECWLEPPLIEHLTRRLARAAVASEDSIWIIPLSRGGESAVRTIGQAQPDPPPPFWVF